MPDSFEGRGVNDDEETDNSFISCSCSCVANPGWSVYDQKSGIDIIKIIMLKVVILYINDDDLILFSMVLKNKSI